MTFSIFLLSLIEQSNRDFQSLIEVPESNIIDESNSITIRLSISISSSLSISSRALLGDSIKLNRFPQGG